MSRALVLPAALVLACTDAREGASISAPAPERADPVMDERPISNLDTLALDCDGPALAAVFAKLDASALAAVDDGPSARLLARWEAARSFSGDSIDPRSVESFIAGLEQELGSSPPRWWIDQLASARRYDQREPPYYDVGLTAQGDRRGELVAGPGSLRVRPAVAMWLTEADGELFFDLSMGRVSLGSLPTDPDATFELARARAGTTLYHAAFSRGSGGFRFPLRATGQNGQTKWQAEVCGPDRKLLGGQGYLTVEIVVLEPARDPERAPGMMQPSSGATGVAVFTAESHGVALDVFDPQTGTRTLAWSSDFWFSR